MSTIDAEKKSLETHVELSELRDKARKESIDALDEKIDDVEIARKEAMAALEKKISDLEDSLQELRDLINEIKDERYKQLIKWGTAVIATLVSALGLLILKILIPIIMSK